MSPARAKLQKAVLNIDLGQIVRNYNALKDLSGLPTLAAVVKANAYGLGAKQVSPALYEAGCRDFFVAHAEEGTHLRDSLPEDANIYVFNGFAEQETEFFIRHKLIPVLNRFDQCETWSKHGQGQPCALHFDTGMNRLGLREAEADRLLRDTALLSQLNIIHVMSHLSCAPDEAHELNPLQLSRFKRITAQFPDVKKSLANSAGLYLGKDYHFDMPRPGCALYGLMATDHIAQEIQKPVASLHIPILQIAEVKAGEAVGYNASYIAPHNMTIATLPIGYADGFPIVPSQTPIAQKGSETFKSVGRVSMDLTLMDITGSQQELSEGDCVTLLGELTETTANAAGCLNYELLTRLGSRFERRYIS